MDKLVARFDISNDISDDYGYFFFVMFYVVFKCKQIVKEDEEQKKL